MPLSDKLTQAQLRTLVRNELLDPNARWWSNSELDQYLLDWQTTIQQDTGWVISTQTFTTTTALNTLTNCQLILEAYWNGKRLDKTEDSAIDFTDPDWRDAQDSVPTSALAIGSNVIQVIPAPSTEGTLKVEHAPTLTFAASTSTSELPAWLQYSAVPYCAYRAYLRHGPNWDLPKALTYKADFEREFTKVRSIERTYWAPSAPLTRADQ